MEIHRCKTNSEFHYYCKLSDWWVPCEPALRQENISSDLQYVKISLKKKTLARTSYGSNQNLPSPKKSLQKNIGGLKPWTHEIQGAYHTCARTKIYWLTTDKVGR